MKTKNKVADTCFAQSPSPLYHLVDAVLCLNQCFLYSFQCSYSRVVNTGHRKCVISPHNWTNVRAPWNINASSLCVQPREGPRQAYHAYEEQIGGDEVEDLIDGIYLLILFTFKLFTTATH